MKLAELANSLSAELHGNAELNITGVATLDSAQDGDLTFLFNRRYKKFLKVTRASAVILSASDLPDCPVAALVVSDPYLAYARAARLLSPQEVRPPGIDPTAWVHPSAKLSPDAVIGPHVVIDEDAVIGEQAIIGPGCVLGKRVRVGSHSHLTANVTVYHDVCIGNRGLIHAGAVLGADGFGLARDQGHWEKIPQLGSVQIGDDVEIGANTTIDRGALKDTVVEDGVKLDNQIQIAHNVRIGAHTAVAGCTAIAGSTTIGKRCMIGGKVGISGHIQIVDDVTIMGGTTVGQSIRKPGVYASGWPAIEASLWRRRLMAMSRLIRATDGSTDE